MAEQLQARRVGPLQVVEHHHDRLLLRGHHQQPHHRREQLVALGVGIGRRRRRQARQPAGEGRDQPGQRRTVRVDVGDELLLGGVGDEVAERLGEELIGRRQVLFAMPEQHARITVERGPSRLGHERGLAQTGLARDEDHLAAAGAGDTLERIQDRRRLGLAAHDTHRRDVSPRRPGSGTAARLRRCPGRLPQHLDRLDRIGQALQGELAQRTALVSAAAPSRQPHDVRSQDLPALTEGAQPGRFDDRVTEVVVVLPTDLAPAQPHPQPHRPLTHPVVTVDALLHGHRARQRRRRGAEHHHQPVTQVLHLGAARLGNRLTQDREVPATQLIRDIGRQRRRRRGRTHHVGEQHRHVLGRHRRHTPQRPPPPYGAPASGAWCCYPAGTDWPRTPPIVAAVSPNAGYRHHRAVLSHEPRTTLRLR